MRKIIQKILIFTIIITAFLAINSFSSLNAEDDLKLKELNNISTSKYILKNGLTVLISQIPTSPVVSIYALVKVGSATEAEYLGSGLCHFIEHMLFKGTGKRDVGEIAAQIQSIGGTINASTGKDYTTYKITVPNDSYDVALDIISDMIMNAEFNSKEIEMERNVIISEMKMYIDNPDRQLNDLTYKNLYIVHPYRHPTIGYETLLKSITRDDLLKFYKSYYAPNNIILSVAGNINKEEILPKIKKTFKSFERKIDIPRNLPVEPTQITPRRFEKEYNTELSRLSVAFPSVSLLDEDLYALDVLAKILGQGKSSRLYLDLYKEKGLVYTIDSFNYTPIDKGYFGIIGLLEDNNVEETIREIKRHIKKIQVNGVQKQELNKAKTQVLSEHVISQQTSAAVAYYRAVDEAFTGDFLFSDRYVEGINSVENDDVVRVANKYLKNDKSNITIIRSKKSNSNKDSKEKKSELGEIKEYMLDNGLTVLLKEDHTFPIVSVNLMLNGGVRQETSELNGISNLTSHMLLRGTKYYSADEISEKAESLGIDIGNFSGKNSFGLNLEFLSKDLRSGVDILEDLIKNSVFPETEINKLKKNVLASIKMRNDSIFEYTDHALRELLFLTHPLRLEETGTEESVNRITREDIVKFYNKFSAPNNMVLTVFGDIDSKNTLKLIEDKFGRLKKKFVDLKLHKEEPPKKQREEQLTLDKKQAMVMLGFQGAQIDDKDRYGIEVLTSILGSPFNGRIFTSIREKLGEAYSLGGFYIPSIDSGIISFYVLTSDESVDEVKKLLLKTINDIQNDFVDEKELKDIKSYLKGKFKMSMEKNSNFSFSVGLDELYGLGYNNYKKYEKNINDITKEDINRLAKKYLDLRKSALVVTMPKEEKTTSNN